MRHFFFKAAIVVTLSLCVMLTPTDAKSKATQANPLAALAAIAPPADADSAEGGKDKKDKDKKDKDDGKMCFDPAMFFGGGTALIATFGSGAYKMWCENTEIGRLYSAMQKAKKKEEDKKGE